MQQVVAAQRVANAGAAAAYVRRAAHVANPNHARCMRMHVGEREIYSEPYVTRVAKQKRGSRRENARGDVAMVKRR